MATTRPQVAAYFDHSLKLHNISSGPIPNLFSATEAHDDDGLPHTLEHLIFLGSEQYPYKGVLDLVANRCLASGTNAWTGRLTRLKSVSNLAS